MMMKMEWVRKARCLWRIWWALIGSGGWSTAAIDSIGKAKTTDIDGPFGLSNFVQNYAQVTVRVSVPYCSEVVSCIDLEQRACKPVWTDGWQWRKCNRSVRMVCTGSKSASFILQWTKIREYYSEDSYLSGVMCSNMVEGALSRGLYVYVKHFAFNDQEANRTNKENCWMSRMGRPWDLFETTSRMAVKDGGQTGLMASYMWFEGKWCGG